MLTTRKDDDVFESPPGQTIEEILGDTPAKRSGRTRRKYTLDRRVVWKRKKLKKGLCPGCGEKKPPENKYFCNACLEVQRKSQRRRYGNKPWKPGSPGRPPLGSNYIGKRRAAQLKKQQKELNPDA